MASLCWFVGAWLGFASAASPARAGALVTRQIQAYVGQVSEGGDQLLLQTEYGSVAFPKADLWWHSLDPALDTYLEVARQVRLAELPHSLVVKLLEESLVREPSLATEAKRFRAQVDEEWDRTLRERAAEAQLMAPLNVMRPAPPPPPRSAPAVSLTLSSEMSEFRGFIDYGGFVLINGQRIPTPMLLPVFSSVSGHSALIIQPRAVRRTP